jgi:single-strand DNA-binding protein
MADVNSVVYTGRLARDVETKDIGGTAICNFAIAVGSWSKSKGDEVSFFDCTAFGHDANFLAKYAKKGSQLTVQGENKQERWEKDGKTMSKVVLKVNRLSLAGGRGNEEKPTGSNAGENTSPFAEGVSADNFVSEIPF